MAAKGKQGMKPRVKWVSKRLKCVRCEGAGLVQVGEHVQQITCPICLGAKWEDPCGNCDGRGTVPGATVPDHDKCPECKGKGYVEVTVKESPAGQVAEAQAAPLTAPAEETEGGDDATHET